MCKMGEAKGKRRSSIDEGARKRFKDSEVGVGSSSEDSQQIIPHAGTINKITLMNFMCHDKLEISFSHGVNFITGRNGTGKSAILTAIVVGLGGKASDTNRACSLKEFVNSNANSAVIRVVINNKGYNSFQSDKYGDEIIVQRTIGPASSQYKIMSSNGAVVSTKHDDLQRILMFLNLQVDNPVAILTQDTARNFLHNTKPTDKYIFFLKATRLEYIQAIYNRVQQHIAATRVIHGTRVKRFESMKEGKNSVEKSLKNLQSVEQTRDTLEAVQNELVWANVKQLECKLEKMQKAECDQENACSQIEDEIAKLDEKIKQIEEKKRACDTMTDTLIKQGNEISANCSSLKNACENLNNNRKAKLDEMASKKEDISKKKREIEATNIQINQMQAALDQDNPLSKEDIDKSLKSLHEEKLQIEAQLKTHQHHLGQLEAGLQSDIESLQSLEAETGRLNQQIAQFRTTLNSLDGKEAGLVKLFGPYVVSLNKEIELAFKKGLFSKMPRGPLGAYVKVKDKSWAPAVESIIGGENLKSYIVNSHQDRKVLYSLINKVIGNSKWPIPSVTACKFMDKVHDYHKNAVQCPGHSSIIDMLDVSDSVVLNCLIDLVSIETTLLVESQSAAREMMEKLCNVPKNCKKVVTKNGDTYYPYPRYRSYCGDAREEAKFLQTSLEDAKRGVLTEINNCKKWAAHSNSQKVEVEKRIKMHRTEIQSARKLLDELHSRRLSIKQEITRLSEIEPPNASAVEFWNEERDGLVKYLEAAEESLTELKKACDVLNKSYKEMSQLQNNLREEQKRKSRDIDTAASKSHHLQNKIMSAQAAMDSTEQKKTEALRTLGNYRSQVKKQKEVVESAISDALKLTKERIETDRIAADIIEEIRTLKNRIERVEQSEGNPQTLYKKYNDLKEKCEMLSKEIAILDACIKKMKHMLRHRREIYSKCLQLLVTRMQMVFQSLIDRRRFQGGIQVDHAEQKLDIQVTLRNPLPVKSKTGAKRTAETGDPKSLSGGERSFSTVAFILSLWDAVELPFYALDEFDVFMDNANREMTLDLLMNHAKEKKDFQFVFLTPQALHSVTEEDDVTIFSLKAHEAQRKAMN